MQSWYFTFPFRIFYSYNFRKSFTQVKKLLLYLSLPKIASLPFITIFYQEFLIYFFYGIGNPVKLTSFIFG